MIRPILWKELFKPIATPCPTVACLEINDETTGRSSDTVIYRWTDSGGKTIYVTAKNAGSAATSKYNVSTSGASFEYYLPLVMK
jgi:hypothetical protein